MRLSPETQRRLTLLNTIGLLVIFAAGLLAAAVAVRTERVRDYLRAMLVAETQQSKTLARLRAARGDGEAAAPLERWGIKIAPRHMRDIEALSAKLVAANALADEDKRWFPAELIVDGESHKGKIRLRGDLSNHWRGAKKSWRFRAKRDVRIHGYRELDLILPRDKAYEVELVAYRAARELGLFAPDAGFVRVALNGVDMGAYFWREPPGKEALERGRYPEGEIFAEQNTWIQEFFSGRGIYRLYSPPISYFPANWEPDIHRDDPSLGHYAARWNRFLDLIASADDARFAAELPRLLDVEKYLTWNALTWLFGSVHSHWGDNLAWYYDPTVGRFEPMLYDVNRYPLGDHRLGTFEADEHDELAVRVLRNGDWRARRNAILWRLVNEPQFDVAARAVAAGGPLMPYLTVGVDAPSRAEVDSYRGETVEILDRNRQRLHDFLAFGRLFAAPTLEISDGEPVLRARLVPDALVRLALERVEVVLADGSQFAPSTVVATWTAPGVASAPDGGVALEARLLPSATGFAVELAAPPTLDTPIDERLVPQMATYELELRFPAASAAAWRAPGAVVDVDWRVRNLVSGQTVPPSHRYRAALATEMASPLALVELPGDQGTAEGDPAAGRDGGAAGLRWRRRGETLVVGPGSYRIDRDLALPPGVGLRLEAGARLLLDPGVSVVVRGPLEVAGTAAQPVELLPADATGPWGGFGVVAPGAPSTVRHLIVRGGSEDWVDGVFLSGQLCFYRADVDIADSTIAGARADDGLNVKRGRVTIRHSTFEGNSGDGFDGDWVEGEIIDSAFTDNGGDGVDFSGSRMAIRGSLFARMGDKALSIGERSELEAVNNVIRDSVIGIAIKDQSRGRLVSSVLYGNETALSLYRKKPIFGGGDGTVVASLLWGNGTDAEVDAESSLRLVGNGRESAEGADRATVEDDRLGDLAGHYRRDGVAGFAHLDAATSPFAAGPKTAPETIAGVEVPDLSTVPIGLLTPLDSP